MVNPLDPNAESGGGLHHKFGSGPHNTTPLPGVTQKPLPAGRSRAPRRIPVPKPAKIPKAAKAPRTPATPPAANSGGASAARTPTTIQPRSAIFLPKTDANPLAGAEDPGRVPVFINPATGALFGLAGGHLFALGHHPQSSGKSSAQSRTAGPHIAAQTRATLLSFDAPSNTAQVFQTDQPDGQPLTVHVNPDIAPARLVAGAVLGLNLLSDSDPTDAIATHVIQ